MAMLGQTVPRGARNAALVTLAAVTVAHLLLWAGWGATPTLGIAVAAGILLLSLRQLQTATQRSLSAVLLVVKKIRDRIIDRRSYRFGLSALLLLVVVTAIPLAWYSNRLQAVANEKRHLNGEWQVVDSQGIPAIVNGIPIVVTFAPAKYTVHPSQEPKWLDFYTPNGVTLRAIYCWKGARLRVRTASPGLGRPESFDQNISDVAVDPKSWTPGQPLSLTDYYLERVTKD